VRSTAAELLGLKALNRSLVLAAGREFASEDPIDARTELTWVALSSDTGNLDLVSVS
jgi:hypothetical protein